jgi:hypothetical protein
MTKYKIGVKENIVFDLKQAYMGYRLSANQKVLKDGLKDPFLLQYRDKVEEMFFLRLNNLRGDSETFSKDKERLGELFKEMIRVKDIISGEDLKQ